MIYLGGPYSHDDHMVMEDRAHQQGVFAVHCATMGHVVYCPVAAWHKWSFGYGLPMTPEFWRRMSLGILRVAVGLWVLKLDGWEASTGLKDEIRCASNLGINISYFHPATYQSAIGRRTDSSL